MIGREGEIMEDVDTARMKRVMDRLYPPPPPPGPPPGLPPPQPPPDHREACALAEEEQRLQFALRRAFRTSRQIAGALSGVMRRSGERAERMRTECFLTGGRLSGRPGPSRVEGPLAALRTASGLLENLSDRYTEAARRSPRQKNLYERYAERCRRDAESVRSVLHRAMR